VNIASALTGIGATTAGMIVVDASRAQTLAPYKGMMAKLATFADGWFLPLTGANLAADGATVVLMSADAYRQSQDIWEGPGEEGDKRKAMALLIAQLAVTGSLITLSLKGNIADLRSGRMLVLDVDENGVPVARSTTGTGETRQTAPPQGEQTEPPESSALDIPSLPQPLIDTLVAKGYGISLQDLQQLIEAVVANGVSLRDLQLVLDNAKDVLIGDKLLNSRYFLQGLAEAGRRNVRDYNLIIEVIKTKNGRYKDAINALCYTTYKARWDYFDIIFDAKYREIHLSVPRGFTDEAQFRAFSQEIRQMLGGEFGNDIRIQGSSLMALPGPVKDIDLAIVMDEQQYLQTLKKVFSAEYFKYQTGGNRREMPANYDRAISDEDFLEFIEYIKANEGNSNANPPVNATMKSLPRAWDSGKLADSKFLSNSQKKERDRIMNEYGLNEMDLSIISTKKGFESGPFLQLLN
jgi:hypothetical protein